MTSHEEPVLAAIVVVVVDAVELLFNAFAMIAPATAVQFVLMLVLVLTVIGIPFAIYYYIRTSLFAQTCVLEDQTAIASLRASARLTRRHWWRTFGFTSLVNVIAILSGPLLGVLILLLTAQSLTFIDITGSLVYTLVVPYAAIALTLYYFDLQARRAAGRGE